MSTAMELSRANQESCQQCPVNVGTTERMLSTMGGAALLAIGLFSENRSKSLTVAAGGALLYRGLSGNCHLYRALGIDRSDEENERENRPAVRHGHGVHFEEAMTIAASPSAIYELWRNVAGLPRFIDHLESVTATDQARSRWVANDPLGRTLQWEAEVFDERPDEFFAWRSLPGGDVDSAGSIRISPLSHDRGTAVRIVMKYDPPGGRVTARLAGWFGRDAHSELRQAVRRMKQLLEAGEIPTTKNQPVGSGGSRIMESMR